MTQQFLQGQWCNVSPKRARCYMMFSCPMNRRCTPATSTKGHTSFILLSSSTRGFSKSRTCVFSAFSVMGPNLDKRFCNHSLPPRRASSLGVSGGSGFVFLFLACALMLQVPLRDLYAPHVCRGCAGRAFAGPSCRTEPLW